MPRIKLRHFLTGADDPTIGNVSVLSRPREWHAVFVGVMAYVMPAAVEAGLTPGVAFVPPEVTGPIGALLYLLGRSNKTLADGILSGETAALTIGHLKDAVKEPAYAGAGFVLAAAVGQVAPHLL